MGTLVGSTYDAQMYKPVVSSGIYMQHKEIQAFFLNQFLFKLFCTVYMSPAQQLVKWGEESELETFF